MQGGIKEKSSYAKVSRSLPGSMAVGMPLVTIYFHMFSKWGGFQANNIVFNILYLITHK